MTVTLQQVKVVFKTKTLLNIKIPLRRMSDTMQDVPAGSGLEYRSKLLKDLGFEEEITELIKDQHGPTGFPKPKKSYRLSWEVYDLSMEEPYFWILDNLKESFTTIEKLEDSFAAAENSAFFGVTQQRLGAQQDKISQFLAQVGKMIKELFQMVRELRIIDERLEYYTESEAQLGKPLHQRGKSAEITLKGMFIDLVQQGAKSAASVYGMARELEFITLPDLFFDAPPFKDTSEMEKYIQGMEANFNQNVLRVLLRHLRQFMEWKKRTHEEHTSRKRFMLQYLRQHFEIIRMYINWVKPYLRHVARLSFKQSNMSSADLISSFEGSMLDIEVLARKHDEAGRTGVNGCILATFYYRTRPELKVVQEGYQRGPVHIGRFEMQLRVYGWTDEQVASYKKLKEKETQYLMGEISSSVQSAMESLGEELDHYLREAGGELKKEERKEEEPAKKSIAHRLFGDFYTPKQLKQKGGKGSSLRQLKKDEEALSEALDKAARSASFVCWNVYHNFKKAHGMIAW